MNKSILAVSFVIAIFAVVVGVAVLAKNNNANPASNNEYNSLSSATSSMPVPTLSVNTNDWKFGSGKVVLMEYSDFQCPACGAYHPLVKQLLAKRGKDITFIYRHFPLPQHLNAIPGARAAEAAGRQGKFWEMHDLLFEKQSEWSELSNPSDTFVSYAKSIKLDTNKFISDYNDNTVKERIIADFKSASELKVNATPSFFVGLGDASNMKKIESIKSVDDFEKSIDSLLK